MTEHNYNVIAPKCGVPIKAWTKGVVMDERQLKNVASLPFIHNWVAVAPR